ncbi:MAG TPA: ATP-binding protein [Bacteroidia bacterium]|nr:ATP-binding protein [Bacteroidia bacterium]
MERSFATHSRVINDLFAQYGNTFIAFCELINNSLQAKAKNIYITIDQAKPTELTQTLIRQIIIRDDGHGVSESDFSYKIMYLGTDAKNGGKGIGRFSALQIGSQAIIETVGFDEKIKKYTKTTLPITEDILKSQKDISKIPVNTVEEILEGKHDTYYQVTINSLYTTSRTESDKKKKIDENLLINKISDAIFTRYPVKIFNKDVKFYINGKYIDPQDFVVGQPDKIKYAYTDKKGDNYDLYFNYLNIKSTTPSIKIFLTVSNAGINTIAASFEYDANWLSPKIGTWFVYIDSDLFTTDMLRNFDFGDLDENGKHIRNFIKDKLNTYFRGKNKEFDDFKTTLRNDTFYPYKTDKATSNSKVIVFDKLAYLVEEKYHILSDKSDLREIIYPLIDKTIAGGSFKNILSNILKLDKKFISKFNELLEKAELEDVIEFSEKVAEKQHNLEFLEKLVYGEISKHILERKQLHKVLEKMLWVFGEQYNDSTKLLSDKNLQDNLTKLRDELLSFSPSKDKDNINDLSDKKLKSITDLFLYSEKILDEETREILIVELKAPKVKISKKELQQAKDYAYAIEQKGEFANQLYYKVLLVGSEFTPQTNSEIRGTSKDKKNNPYFYWENQDKNIEIWVMRWVDLIENTKRKLKYISSALKVKDVDVKQKFESDFEEIDIDKLSSRLQKTDLHSFSEA